MFQPAFFQTVFVAPLTAEPLAVEEERGLIASAQLGDGKAVERLVIAYAPALRAGVRPVLKGLGMSPSPTDVEDVRSNAVLGLLEAIHAFDGERHERLAAIAPAYVRDAVSKSAASASSFTIPERTLKRFFGILRAADGDAALAMELAPEYEMKRETFLAVLEAVRGVESLDDANGNRPEEYSAKGGGYVEEDGWSRSDVAPLANPIADAEDRILIEVAFRAVDELERDVVGLAYGFTDYDPVPDAEIANRLGYSRPKIQRVRSGALGKMRARLGVIA